MPHVRPTIRLDKWLWHARFFRSRVLAIEMVTKGRVRLNGNPVRKPGHAVGSGDTLTFAMGDNVRLIRVVEIGQRRGPTAEAQLLYIDLDPPPDGDGPPVSA